MRAHLIAAITLFSTPTVAQTFSAGELLINSQSLTGPGGNYKGVLRIEPLSGATEVLATWDSPAANSMGIAYDPARDRVLASGDIGDDRGLFAIDSSGGAELLVPNVKGFSSVAPTGDGRVYLLPIDNSDERIQWIDAAGVLHTLLDVGSAVSLEIATDPYKDLIYDPGTDSLLLATRSNANVLCPNATSQPSANFWRLPLTPDGTALREDQICSTFDISPGVSVEWPRGWSRGPGGAFMVGLSGHTTQERSVLRVEPEAMTISEFCGYSTCCHSVDGATYSNALGKMLILDNFDHNLLAFDPGEFGDGTPLALDSTFAFLGSGTNMRMVEVGGVYPNSGLSVSGSFVSVGAGGAQTLQVDLGPDAAGDFYFVVGSMSGWGPGFDLAGWTVPLQLDWYTEFTVKHPNAVPLPTSFAALDASGRGSTLFALPAASPSILAGATVWHTAVRLSPALEVLEATNAVPIALVP